MTDPIPVVRTLNGSPYRTLDEFFAKHGNHIQYFSINPERRTTIISNRGIRFTILPNAICDSQGFPVNGEVELRLIELFDQIEMILADKSTLSEDRLLETGGQFLLEAAGAGKEPLQLVQPVVVEFPVRGGLRNTLAMRLYAGSTSKTRAFAASRSFDWGLVSGRPLTIRKILGGKFFRFQIETFNWYSINHLFAKRASRTMVSAKILAPVDELDDQAAFLMLEDINALARMHVSGNRFTLFNVPAKMPARVLVIGLRQGQMYFGESLIEKTSNRQIHISLIPLSEAEVLSCFQHHHVLR